MTHRQKLKQLARILIDKYNGAARQVARKRVQQSFDNEDYASAHLWTDVAETLRQIAGDQQGARTAAR
jgi:hypothetical protein